MQAKLKMSLTCKEQKCILTEFVQRKNISTKITNDYIQRTYFRTSLMFNLKTM